MSSVRASTAEALAGSRAVGAMFLFAFGAAWLLLWVYRGLEQRVLGFALVLVAASAFLFVCYRRYLHHRPALQAEPETAASRRASRVFNIVNVGQWLIILVVGNVLVNIDLSAWVIPAAML